MKSALGSGKIGNIATIAATALTASALWAAGPAPAQADTLDDRRKVAVPYTDLNLADKDGIERLDRRLHRAVARVCGRRMASSASEAARDRDCRHTAWAGIEPQRAFAIARAQGAGGAVLAGNTTTGSPIGIGAAD